MENLLVYAGIPAVLLIMGISQILKNLGLNAKYIPLANLIMGIGSGIALNTDDWKNAIFMGLAVGLGASGLYSGVKNVSQGIKE